MWYVRPTHATVSTEYVLKIKSTSTQSEHDCLALTDPENRGYGKLPYLSIRGDHVFVEFDDADILRFENKIAFKHQESFNYVTVVLVDRTSATE
jgi:hypothetical protein